MRPKEIQFLPDAMPEIPTVSKATLMRVFTMMRSGRRPHFKRSLLSLLVSMIFLSLPLGTALGQDKPPQAEKSRVAVLEFQGVDVSVAEIASATDQLRDNIVKIGRFIVLDRQQTEAVLGEQAFQQEGVTDASRATELGRLLNVEYIIVGRLTRLRGAYQVNAQMVEVETATIIRSETYRQRSDFLDLLDHLGPLADTITQIEGVPEPELPKEEEPAPAGEPRPPVASIQSNAIRPSPPGKLFVEGSLGAFSRAMEATLTFKSTSGLQFVSDPTTDDMGYSRATVYVGMVLGPGILRGGVGSFGVSTDEEDPDDEEFRDLGGSEVAVDYRGDLGSEVSGFHLGYFASLRFGSVSNEFWEGSFGVFDGGINASYVYSEAWTFYGAGVLSNMTLTLEPTSEYMDQIDSSNTFESITLELASVNPLGMLGGFSYAIGERMLLGVELHGGFESGLAVNFAYLL